MGSVKRSYRRTRKVWKDAYKVGVEEIDTQHRGFLDLINDIGDLADAQYTEKSDVFRALNSMIRYAENHFRTEEGYLEKYGYPEYPQQKEEHEAFVERAFEMVKDLEEEGFLTFGAIIMFLEDWYTDHVAGTDQKYKEFLLNKIADETKVVPG